MPAIAFSGPYDSIDAGLASSGNDAVYFEAAIPNPKFDPEDYIEVRGKKKYWEKPTLNIAYLTIELKGDAYSVGKAWTHESYRRQGIIRRLYDMAWDYARSKGKGFQAGWVQSPLMAKYWESLVDQGKAEAYTDEWTHYNTTGKGWRRIHASPTKRRRRNGDCYEAAGRYIMDNFDSQLQLVHGEVSGQGAMEGTTFGHAWVLDGDTVIDKSNGRDLRVPKVVYYALGGIDRIDNLHVYSREQALDRMLKHKHFGPWDLKTRSGL